MKSITPFHRWASCHSDRWRSLPKVAQSVNGRARAKSQADAFFSFNHINLAQKQWDYRDQSISKIKGSHWVSLLCPFPEQESLGLHPGQSGAQWEWPHHIIGNGTNRTFFLWTEIGWQEGGVETFTKKQRAWTPLWDGMIQSWPIIAIKSDRKDVYLLESL